MSSAICRFRITFGIIISIFRRVMRLLGWEWNQVSWRYVLGCLRYVCIRFSCGFRRCWLNGEFGELDDFVLLPLRLLARNYYRNVVLVKYDIPLDTNSPPFRK